MNYFRSHFDDCFWKSSFLLFLEDVCHSQVGIGYEIFGHFRVADDIIKSVDELVTDAAAKKVTVVLGAQKVKHCEASEFREECTKYFERYYKTLAKKVPLVLPSVLPTKLKGVVDTMCKWCESTAKGHHVKGLVLHSVLIKDLYLKMYHDELNALSQKLNIEDFPSTPSIVAYNPNERILLFIRTAESEDVGKEIKLCSAELKMFMLIVGEKLKDSGIKVIPLTVTDKDSKCMDCRSYLISGETIVHFDLFMKWYEQKSMDFDITPADYFEENIVNDVFAKIVSCMGATKIHNIFPIFITEEEKQMQGALLLLTPEQIDILYSEDKHIIIDGPYGSGKSIIGRTKAKMIADNLAKNELLYYISYDSRSALLNEIQISNPKITIYPDTEEQRGSKLSDMIKTILKKNKLEKEHHEENNKNGKKLNLIIDEYDGEKLDKREASTLNSIINTEYKKIFQDAVILMINQSMKKERWANNDPIDSNRFDLLEQMQKKTLTLVMRNSMQIHNLLEVTKEVLEGVATRYKLNEKKKKDLREEKYDHKTNKESNSDKSESEVVTVIKQSKTSASERLKTSSLFAASRLELDEAFYHAGTPTAHDADGSKIENRFKYEEAKQIGHEVKSKLPILYEVYCYDNAFEKVFSLTVVFEKLQLALSTANNKHVMLHFNVNNEIPRLTFKLFDVKHNTKLTDKVTYSYEDFKNEGHRKYIFVGNFRTFRGLERPRITIIVDHDIYSLRHYLVECIARCTTYLHIVLLGVTKTLNIITQKWKERINGNPLIKSWEIMLSKDGKQPNKVWNVVLSILSKVRKQSMDAGTEKNEGILIDTSSEEYKKLEQTFNEPSFQKNEVEDLVSKREAKIAIQM